MIDKVLVARFLVPVFTLLVGVPLQYLFFYEPGMTILDVLLNGWILWILYFLAGLLLAEHFLRLIRKRS